jgi:cytochrome c556
MASSGITTRELISSMPRKTISALVVVAALVAAGIATAQVKQGKTRPARTSHLMKGVIKPNCDALKKAIEAAPADEKAWKALAVNAAMLNEISYALMEDGRCPDAKWADANKLMQTGSADLLKAISGKDHTALKSAFGTTMKSCKACHDAHKEK